MTTPIPSRKNSVTEVKFDVDISVIPFGRGVCGFFCNRKVEERPVIYDRGIFRASPRSSQSDELEKTVRVVADLIRQRCEDDEERFRIVCRACKFNPENDKAVTIRTLVKLKEIFED